jgi:hypothetical protein
VFSAWYELGLEIRYSFILKGVMHVLHAGSRNLMFFRKEENDLKQFFKVVHYVKYARRSLYDLQCLWTDSSKMQIIKNRHLTRRHTSLYEVCVLPSAAQQ